MNTIDHDSRRGQAQANTRRRSAPVLAGLIISIGALGASLAAQAATYSVGPGADGCTHTTLSAAVAAAATAPGGPHLIKLRNGIDYLIASRIDIIAPVADLAFEGGYASCGDLAPTATGVSTIRRDPASLSTNLLLFDNDIANPRRTIRIERISLRDGIAVLGGALTILGNTTVEIGRLSEIRDNEGTLGGGIYMLNNSEEAETRGELILSHGVEVHDNRTRDFGMPIGGGIAGHGNVRVTIQHASFRNNRARTMGGAIHLSGERARLWLDPVQQAPMIPESPLIAFQNNEAGPRAFDPDAPFDSANGFGGAIALTFGAELWSSGNRSFNRPGVRFENNRANFGGAIHAEGRTSPHSFAVLLNTEVRGNRAYGKGGAFHVKNAMDLQLLSSGAGPCWDNLPCARAIDNVADNEGDFDIHPAGGVVYVTTDDDASRGIFRSGGALYLDNMDTNGTAAVAAAWRNDSKLSFVRGIFDGNRAGGDSTYRAMIDSTSNDVTFYFNTVVRQHPDTGRLFYTGAAAGAKLVQAQGSIFWQGVSTPITNEPTAGKVVPGSVSQFCLNLHDEHWSELSAVGGAISTRDPRLDASYAIRPRAEIDACAVSRGDVHYGPDIDAWGLPTNVDVPSIDNWQGPVDMGAIERGDIIIYNGFGTYPGS